MYLTQINYITKLVTFYTEKLVFRINQFCCKVADGQGWV